MGAPSSAAGPVAGIEATPRHRIAYSLAENAARVEGWNEEWLESLKAFWFKRFFADEYINFDEPVDGAPGVRAHVPGAPAPTSST